MGYEYRLYKMKKEDAEKLSKMSYEEVEKKYGEDEWFYTGHLPMKELHSNGDLNGDEVNRIKVTGTRLLVHESFDKTEEEAIVIIDKEGVLAWIECYRERVIKFLDKMVNGNPDLFGMSKEEKRERYLTSLLDKWTNYPPYEVNDESISHSSDYEYIIFELVYQLKSLKEDEVFVFASH